MDYKDRDKQREEEFEKTHNIQGINTFDDSLGADSYFDGGLLGFIGWGILATIVIVLTLGIGTPWAICMLYSYQFKHTVYSGFRLKFNGKGGSLFLNILKWTFFSIITLGIYSIFVPVKRVKWITSNLSCDEEGFVKGDSYFTGNTLQLIGLNILSFILVVLSFGILYPFTICLKLRWITKHTVINKKGLVFTGSAISLWGHYILWTLLSIVTLGIFSFWVPVMMLKWQSKNIHMKTVIERAYPKDKSIWLAIPITILGAVVLGFLIKGLISYDWNRSNIELKVMNVVTRIQPSIGKKDDVDDVKKAMYSIVKEKYTNGYISEDEMDRLVDKYDLDDYVYEESDIIDRIVNTKVPVSEKDFVAVGNYKISFGTYTGEDSLFDIEKQESIPVHIKIVIEDDGIIIDGNKKKYTVDGDKISVEGTPIIQVVGDNKPMYLVQSCPTLTYQGK